MSLNRNEMLRRSFFLQDHITSSLTRGLEEYFSDSIHHWQMADLVQESFFQ